MIDATCIVGREEAGENGGLHDEDNPGGLGGLLHTDETSTTACGPYQLWGNAVGKMLEDCNSLKLMN